MVFLKGLRESTSGFTTLSHLHIQNTIWYLLHHVTMADRDQRSSWISTCIVIPILFHLWEDRLNSKDWVLLLYCRFLHSVVSSHLQRPSKGQALNATGCNSPSYHLSNNDNSNNRKCSLTPASHFPFHKCHEGGVVASLAAVLKPNGASAVLQVNPVWEGNLLHHPAWNMGTLIED